MSVLRANKESLMAVLEAFVYDPLINWRLMQADVDTRRQEGSVNRPSITQWRLTFVPSQTLIPTRVELLSLPRLRHIPKPQPENSARMKMTFLMVRCMVTSPPDPY